VLIVIEMFLPSAGLIATVAACCGIAGVVCLFLHDWRWGLGGGLSLIILTPLVFAFGLHVMPATKMGRRLIHGGEGEPQSVLNPNAPNPLLPLLGKEGEAITDLRPIGAVRIEGLRHDGRAEVAYIRAGTRVRVSSVENEQIVVRPA
jgi:membrane-bound serine protease (ClpP class)